MSIISICSTTKTFNKTLLATTVLGALTTLSLTGCQTISDTANKGSDQVMESAASSSNKPTLYYNGDIITMAGDSPQQVEALVEQDGKIAYVGSLQAAQQKYSNALKMNLNNKTLLPGFIDPHSHFGMVSNAMGQADLNPPPVGKVSSIKELQQVLKQFKADNNIADGEWIFGWGYDDNQIKEGRHPTKEEIDAVLPNNPVYLQHTSGHMGVANSLGLKKMKITADAKAPEGGHIERKKGSKEPTGLVQETAMYPFMRNLMSELEPQQAKFFEQTQNLYAANGITTAQDGMTSREAIGFFQQQADAGKLKIDLVALPGYTDLETNLNDKNLKWGTYHNGFKLQGTKIVNDGSPQGKTAYFTKPYLTPVSGCDKDCRGLPSIPQEELNRLFELAYKNNNQLFIHNNGDAAIDMVIKAHEYASKKTSQALDKDRRTIVVHSQFMRPDQLQTYKKYNLVPSFFTNHAFFWGDTHVKNLGKERAFFLSPIASADKLGLKYTNHSDATVTPIDPIYTMWTAVNRVSRSGKVIGPDERATPYQALKAITDHAAFEYFEEESKGTLETGKLADMVILDQNPLKIDPMQIKDIKVVKTIKDGEVIFDSEK